ncbi:aminotransferase-like domain-containing protein [Zooshikella harenae]|uniref:PLP-dependent aminotransferase family protein n=1 Tax=Zooshikella harenae TaxID=2827238 RepID=A0ABS5ZDW5_9GAMM|nr:PLP-dependent aminotransferase family protein [Zooshikella harenae]MBU2712165.1 PLP-dependent aminotransferase family protein [Zooshikella harenae]
MKQLLYLSLAQQLCKQIHSGVFIAGQRLPSVRVLAQQTNMSISTVLRAYQLVEDKGLIEARHKSGYYVSSELITLQTQLEEQKPISPEWVTGSALIVDLIANATKENFHQFSTAQPAEDIAANKEIKQNMLRILRDNHLILSTNSELIGSLKLRQQLAYRLTKLGILASVENILITTGCQSAMMLCLKTFTRPGDVVAIATPAYYRILQLMEVLQLKVVEIPTHSLTGIDIPLLKKALSEWSVKAIIISPTVGNPLGESMSKESKQQLLTLIEEKNIPLIEDDAFADLSFEQARPEPIKALDKKGVVWYCGTVSKTISPQLKVGWMVMGEHADRVIYQHSLMGITPPHLNQLAVAEYLAQDKYQKHLQHTILTYQQRYYQTLSLIKKYFPKNIRVSSPTGGFVLWIELPEYIDATKIYFKAKQQGILITPGELFSVQSSKYKHCLRINFSKPWTEDRTKAIIWLGHFIEQQNI